jgi:hypothetical protein
MKKYKNIFHFSESLKNCLIQGNNYNDFMTTSKKIREFMIVKSNSPIYYDLNDEKVKGSAEFSSKYFNQDILNGIKDYSSKNHTEIAINSLFGDTSNLQKLCLLNEKKNIATIISLNLFQNDLTNTNGGLLRKNKYDEFGFLLDQVK